MRGREWGRVLSLVEKKVFIFVPLGEWGRGY